MTKLKEAQIKRFNQAKKYLDDNNIKYELVSKTDSLDFFKIKDEDWWFGYVYDEELSSYDIIKKAGFRELHHYKDPTTYTETKVINGVYMPITYCNCYCVECGNRFEYVVDNAFSNGYMELRSICDKCNPRNRLEPQLELEL